MAALLVVMFHVQALLGPLRASPPFHGLFGAASSGVDLFFVLSGFIMVYIHHDDVGRPDRAAPFFYKRLARLYPGATLLSLAALAAYLVGNDPERATKLLPTSLAASLLLLPQQGVPLLGVTWTLAYEVFFYALFGLAIVSSRFGFAAIFGWQAAALVLLPHAPPEQAGWSAYVQPICLEFGFGMLAGLIVRHRDLLRGGHAARIAVTTFGAALFLGATFAGRATHDLGGVLVLGGGAAFAIGGMALWESARPLAVPRPLVFLGDASYAIYLVHFPVLAACARLLPRIGMPAPDDMTCLLAAMAAIGAGTLFYIGFDRPVQRVLRRRRWA